MDGIITTVVEEEGEAADGIGEVTGVTPEGEEDGKISWNKVVFILKY